MQSVVLATTLLHTTVLLLLTVASTVCSTTRVCVVLAWQWDAVDASLCYMPEGLTAAPAPPLLLTAHLETCYVVSITSQVLLLLPTVAHCLLELVPHLTYSM